MHNVYIDADGCPVKEETYKVAERYAFGVFVVANHYIKVPKNVNGVVVGDGFDEADDWIAERAQNGDIVITADILLAKRCLDNNAQVIGHKGKMFTVDSIGNAIAQRELSQQLREMGVATGGPSPMDKKARSQFLSSLDEAINRARRLI